MYVIGLGLINTVVWMIIPL